MTDKPGDSIEDFIGVFPALMSQEWCDKAIKLFDVRSAWSTSGGTYTRSDLNVQDENISMGVESQLDCYDSVNIGWDNAKFLIEEFNAAFWGHVYQEYKAKYPVLDRLAKHRMSSIKLQKTLPSQGYHIWHCETGDIDTGRRVMFVILYLNDVEEGGETEFLFQSKRIKPTRGTLVLAPSAYTHVHRGNPPLSGAKYILTTWLEFVE